MKLDVRNADFGSQMDQLVELFVAVPVNTTNGRSIGILGARTRNTLFSIHRLDI